MSVAFCRIYIDQMKNESVNIAHIGNDAMQAKKIAESFAEQKWPNPPIGIEAIFFPGRPDGAYYRDTRPLSEPGWYHFFIVGTYLGFGGTELICVNPSTEEVLYFGMIGE